MCWCIDQQASRATPPEWLATAEERQCPSAWLKPAQYRHSTASAYFHCSPDACTVLLSRNLPQMCEHLDYRWKVKEELVSQSSGKSTIRFRMCNVVRVNRRLIHGRIDSRYHCTLLHQSIAVNCVVCLPSLLSLDHYTYAYSRRQSF